MQKLNKRIIKAVVAVVMVMPLGAAAQTLTSSINTYSPYSMYGLGELATQGNVAMRSMGGMGVAMQSNVMVNVLNPAAYAFTARKSFLFDFGIDAGHYRNAQNKYGTAVSEVKTAYNSMNFHEIAFQLPLAQNVGFGFSLTPYSNVGYNMYSDDVSSDIAGNVGRVRYQYYGEGDVTEVKFGVGWRPFKYLSIGAAMQYYWGDIKRNYKSEPADVITGSGTFSTTTGVDTYDVSKIKAQFGVQWAVIANTKRALTLGATYDIGGALKPKMVKYVYVDNILSSVVRNETDNALPLRLPQQLSVGLYYQTMKIRAGVDYVYQNWGNQNSGYIESEGKGIKVAYTNTNTIKAGVEIRPRPTDVRNYLNRMAYRVGVRYGDYYQTFGGTTIKQYALTAGLGFPIKLFGQSSIDIGFEFGMRDPQNNSIMLNNKKVGLVKQNFYKLSVGLTMFGEDRWFQRYKFE